MAQSTRRKPAMLGKYQVILDKQAVPYAVMRSYRAKHARLEIKPATGLTVVIPGAYKMSDIADLLTRKKRWVLGKLGSYGNGLPPGATAGVKDGDYIPYLDWRLKVIERRNAGTAAGINLEKNRLVVNLNSQNIPLELVLERWYRQQAEGFISKRTGELSRKMGVTYGRLTIKGAKTRWGSCSHKGNLNFNWRLMMTPEPVIDYVIIHELAHLKEMNHSIDFWKLVAEYCPRWRSHRKWLREHEAELACTLTLQ